MRKIFVCLLLLVSLQMAAQCDFWKTTVSIDGKYAAYNEKGVCTIPPVFEEMYFWGTSPVCYAKYNGKYYLIDRKGCMVGDEGWDKSPSLYTNYAVVGNAGHEYIMDFKGRKLTNGVSKITAYKNIDNVFCLFDNNKYRLVGIDGRNIISDCESITPLANAPLFKFCKNGLYGICNLEGDVVIPPASVDIAEYNFGYLQLNAEYYKKQNISSIYTEDELAAVTFLFTYVDNVHFEIYDIAGTLVASNLESADYAKVFEKIYKKYTQPYLLDKTNNQQCYFSKITEPYNIFQQRENQYLNNLPKTDTSTAQVSLVEIAQKGLHVEAMKLNQKAISKKTEEVSEVKSVAPVTMKTEIPKTKYTKKKKLSTALTAEANNKKTEAVDGVTAGNNANKANEAKPSEKDVKGNNAALSVSNHQYGVIPKKFEDYYSTKDGKMSIIINGSYNGSELIFSSSFNGGKSVVVALGNPGTEGDFWTFRDTTSKLTILLKKDWSSVKVRVNKTLINVYDKVIGKKEYDEIKKTE